MLYRSQRPSAPLALVLGALLIPTGYAQQAAQAPAPPAAAPAAAAPGNSSLSSSLGLFVFPAKNQSSSQQSTDEGACYGWAKSQTGIDPVNIKPPAPAQPSQEQAASSGGGERVRGAAKGAAGGKAPTGGGAGSLNRRKGRNRAIKNRKKK